MSFRLTPINKFHMEEWLQRSGFKNFELDFWSTLSSITKGTSFDHMVSYLTELGYTGGANDQLRTFLQDQATVGTTYDNANQMFQGTYATGTSGTKILAEDGSELLAEDGTTLLTE